MSDRLALTGARIFDGDDWHDDAALIVRGGVVEAIVPRGAVPSGVRNDRARRRHAGARLRRPAGQWRRRRHAQRPSRCRDRIATICRAHAPFGTTALLPTLITDTPEITAAAIAAGSEAARQKVPGFLGLHLEGPHLSVARKGAHDPALIRPMTDADQAALIAARENLPVLLTTVAPESVDARAESRRSPRPASSSASAIPTPATPRPRAVAEAGATHGHASVQRHEPDRQPRAGPGRRGASTSARCPPGSSPTASMSIPPPSASRCAPSRGRAGSSSSPTPWRRSAPT